MTAKNKLSRDWLGQPNPTRMAITEEQIRHLRDALDSHIWMMNDRGEGYGRGEGSIKACEELDEILNHKAIGVFQVVRFLAYDKFGSFYRLNNGVLECQPQMADPKLNFPLEEEWNEVDWDRGVEPQDLAQVKEIVRTLEEDKR